MAKENRTYLFRGRPMMIDCHSGDLRVHYPEFSTQLQTVYSGKKAQLFGKRKCQTILRDKTEINFNSSIFTLRNLEVLRLLAEGLLMPEIAETLGISNQTVKALMISAYRRNSTEEKYVQSYLELVLLAEHLELLYPISILGLRHILEQQT